MDGALNEGAAQANGIVFLLDVDNTLLDNDEVKSDLDRRMSGFLDPEEERRFWDIYEQVRIERDVVDFPLTLDRFKEGAPAAPFERLRVLLTDYRFDRHLYPDALETIHHLRTFGTTLVVSDGDNVFQPRKIEEAGITDAVGGSDHVLIFTHKEQSIERVLTGFPGGRYVMVDDKRRILATLKRDHGDRFTTVHVAQGHYAQTDPDLTPKPDIEVQHIADLRRLNGPDFVR